MATADLDTFWIQSCADVITKETSDQEYADLSFYCYLTKLRYLVKSAATIDRVRLFATKGLEQFDRYPDGVRPVAKNMYFEAMVVLMGLEKASVSSKALRWVSDW